MIKEALEYLSRLATEATSPTEIKIADPRADRFIVGKEVVHCRNL